jgi:methionine synthase II (cobalamin-independent)
VFATLLGELPRPPLRPGAPAGDLVRAALAAQVEAGLEPVTDGGWWQPDRTPVERWEATAALTDRAVKAAVVGPYSAHEGAGDRALLAAAEAGNAELRALAAAGCPLIEVHEPAATSIGEDAAARERFVSAHRTLLAGLDGVHVSLAITGGSADAAGIETLLAAPYASLALDLVRGPDNWYLAAAAPGKIGIVCGALTADEGGDETVEILLYALGYAASTGGRGPDRVGVATAGSLEGVPWPVAERRMRRLGQAVRLATGSREERAAAVDPRAVSSRAAALGRPGIRLRRSDRDQ